jgi:hypothetical protein
MSIFNELKTSLEEAVEIKQGKKKVSRVTRYQITYRFSNTPIRKVVPPWLS